MGKKVPWTKDKDLGDLITSPLKCLVCLPQSFPPESFCCLLRACPISQWQVCQYPSVLLPGNPRKLMTVSTGEPYRTDSHREYEQHDADC